MNDKIKIALEHALSTLECGRAFAGISKEEFNNWCGHADLVEQEIRDIFQHEQGQSKNEGS